MLELEFVQLLTKYPDAIGNKRRFTGLIKDLFPGQQMQNNLILMAYNMGLVQALESADVITNALAYGYVKRLMEEHGVARANADWCVSMWCVCYGQRVLHKPCEITLGGGKDHRLVITDEKPVSVPYGELYQYEKSSMGYGLSVSGFNGNNWNTLIFQGRIKNDSVVEIKAHSFMDCPVEEAIMTEGYVKLGTAAFQNCRSLRQIVLPMSLREVGAFAVAGCQELKSVALPEGLEQIGDYAFSGTGLKGIQLPKSVDMLGEGVFSGCSQLDNVEIRRNIDAIPARAFQNCTGLKKIRLHEELASIGDEAFKGCSSLMCVHVPDSVTQIGERAFEDMHDKFVMMCSMGSHAESYARSRKIRYQLV